MLKGTDHVRMWSSSVAKLEGNFLVSLRHDLTTMRTTLLYVRSILKTTKPPQPLLPLIKAYIHFRSSACPFPRNSTPTTAV